MAKATPWSHQWALDSTRGLTVPAMYAGVCSHVKLTSEAYGKTLQKNETVMRG